MSTITHGVDNGGDTSNSAIYTTGSFTPTAGDLAVVFVQTANNDQVTADTVLSDSSGGTYKQIALLYISGDGGGTAETLGLYVAEQLCDGSNISLTLDLGPSDSANGCGISVELVNGMTKTGLDAIRQLSGQAPESSGTTPQTVFTDFGACLTENPTLTAVYRDGGSNGTMGAPTGWSLLASCNYGSPISRMEVAGRDGGFTGDTITWGSSSDAVYAVMSIELDTSGSGGGGSGDIKVGSTSVTSMKIGTTSITKVYVGTTEVWTA